MAQAPRFVQRVARIPAVLALLADYPGGLTLGDLAARFGTDASTLREDLTAYLDVESWGWSHDIFRTSPIEFVATDGPGDAGTGAETDTDTVVRVVDDETPSGLGVEHLSAGDLAIIYTAGTALLDVEPDDADLDAALRVISETMYGTSVAPPSLPDWNRNLAPLQEAQQERRRVRVVYSRAWRDGVLERVVEPLRLVQTHRGWEVDAGPVGPEGRLRTYLVSNVREAQVLDETFVPPAGLERLLHLQRETRTVRLDLRQDARWAADMWAEQVAVVTEDEETFEADLELLPPAGERVGLLLLASGPASRVVEPTTLLPEALGVVGELLAHHEQTP